MSFQTNQSQQTSNQTNLSHSNRPAFRVMEMFAGIGGFHQGLQRANSAMRALARSLLPGRLGQPVGAFA